jgi:hypothetical protein
MPDGLAWGLANGTIKTDRSMTGETVYIDLAAPGGPQVIGKSNPLKGTFDYYGKGVYPKATIPGDPYSLPFDQMPGMVPMGDSQGTLFDNMPLPLQPEEDLGDYTLEDLEYTAQKNGLTVEQVKQLLGITQ